MSSRRRPGLRYIISTMLGLLSLTLPVTAGAAPRDERSLAGTVDAIIRLWTQPVQARPKVRPRRPQQQAPHIAHSSDRHVSGARAIVLGRTVPRRAEHVEVIDGSQSTPPCHKAATNCLTLTVR